MAMDSNSEYSFAEYRLAKVLRILAFVFGAAALGYLLPALFGGNKDFFINLPFVTNSVVKVSLMALLAMQAAGDIRRYRSVVSIIIIGHIISIVATLAALIWGEAGREVVFHLPFGSPAVFPVSRVMWGSVILDALIVVLLYLLYRAAEKERYQLRYLTPTQFRSLVALSESLIIGKSELVNPHQIAIDVDQYLSSFRAKTKWVFKLVLTAMDYYPLLSFHVPLSTMNPVDRRRFVESRFYERASALPAFWRDLVRVMIRISKQLAYLGYYNNPKVFPTVGYVPFELRPDTPEKKKIYPE
ncbi:MAG TPA: hypothetical protein VM187_18955, partial [Niastella sp.]|nr:hypothetical protein [Niastella sp.]